MTQWYYEQSAFVSSGLGSAYIREGYGGTSSFVPLAQTPRKTAYFSELLTPFRPVLDINISIGNFFAKFTIYLVEVVFSKTLAV